MHGFRRAHEWEEIHDPRSNQHNRYIVGYESQECRIAFYYEPDAIAVLIGTVVDRFEDLRDADLRRPSGWLGLDDLLAYMLKRPAEWYDFPKGKPYPTRVLEPLSKTAREFESLADRILRLCRDRETFAHLKPTLEANRREELKRRFGVG
jgi:hypothetical protein